MLPSLRERPEDILPLANHFLGKHSTRAQQSFVEFSDEVAEQMVCYDWPGNVRELQNAVERAVVFAGSRNVIHLEDFAGAMGATIRSFSPRLNIARVETIDESDLPTLILKTLILKER